MTGLENGATEEREEKKENGVGEVLSEFALSTTAHGVGHIAASSHSHIKIAWLITWLGVMAAFAYMIVKLILLYTSYPVSTSISMAYQQITNLTSGKDSILRNEMRNTSSLTGVFQSSQRSLSSDELASLQQDDVQSGRSFSFARINSLSVDVLKEAGHQFEDFLTMCSWAGLLCHKGLLLRNWKKSWHWRYGNCFTFNGQSVIEGLNGSLHDPLKSSIAFSNEGLTLTLDVQMKEYTSLALEEGIRVLIEDQDVRLYPEMHGFSIRPGVKANIALKKHIIQREDVYNNNSCREFTRVDTTYTLQNCIMAYKGFAQLSSCNCTEVQYFQILNARPCKGTREDSCIASVNREFAKESADLSKECPPPCSEVLFEKTVTQGKIFAAGYLETYGIKNMTKDYVAKNIIQLHIHYEDQTVATIKTETYYKFDNLISDVGGQLGLWIGVSAVTVIEFLALSWNLIIYFANKRRKRGIRSSSGKDHS